MRAEPQPDVGTDDLQPEDPEARAIVVLVFMTFLFGAIALFTIVYDKIVLLGFANAYEVPVMRILLSHSKVTNCAAQLGDDNLDDRPASHPALRHALDEHHASWRAFVSSLLATWGPTGMICALIVR